MSSDTRRIRLAAVVFGAVVIGVAALVSSAAAVRRTAADPPLVVVRMAGSSEFFDDPAVKDALRRDGLRVEQDPLGSLAVAGQISLAHNYDIANTASPDTARHVEKRLKDDGVNAQESSPFSSPMVILTHPPIVDLLTKLGVVTNVGGILVFDMKNYLLNVVGADLRWTQIPGNQAYRNNSRILVNTTDPRYANSGGMFAVIASSAQTGDIVRDVRTTDAYLPLVHVSFAAQGIMPDHTPKLLDRFLTDQLASYPMAMVYEKDGVTTRLKSAHLRQSVAMMYPNPTVDSDNTFIWWTEIGRRLADLLRNDPVLVSLEKRAGYRTSSDGENFVRTMAANGITVPDLERPLGAPTFVGLPTDDDYQKLINAVYPG